jgi:hypothetical protein
MEIDEKIEHAIKNTKVMRSPKQKLATFGVTNITYYLITEPVYGELVKGSQETVIRDGRVISERPKIVTPSYLTKLEGFGENARGYIEKLVRERPDAAGLFYSYRNELRRVDIVSGPVEAVADRLNQRLDKAEDPLTAIIKGVDELWDVSLLKFIAELTEQSVRDNVAELRCEGLLGVDESGVTMHGRYLIEQLFEVVRADPTRAGELRLELERWGLWSEYEDRFLELFRGR